MKYIQHINERGNFNTEITDDEKEKLLIKTNNRKFKSWFGDSKIVDSNGNPLIVYHGTKNEFSEFRFTQKQTPTRKIGIESQLGFWFVDNIEIAKMYGRNIMAAFISIENPVTYNGLEDLIDDIFYDTPGEKFLNGTIKQRNDMYDARKVMYNENRFKYMKLYKDYLLKEDIDGIIINSIDPIKPHISYICFYSNQIKSVMNDGTWNDDTTNFYR